MKNIILFAIITVIAWSCSNNNDDSQDGYPSTFRYLFDFIKSDGTNFEHQEVQHGVLYKVFNNDTVFFNVNNTWSLFQIHQVDENMQTDGQPPINDYFYSLEIHPSYITELPDGSEWTMTTSKLFKYEGYEDVDKFMIKWHGKFLSNSRELEYLQKEYYLNDEPFEPFYGNYFRIEK